MDDDTTKKKGQRNHSLDAKTDNSNRSATMATTTTIPTQVTAAAALMLANTGMQGSVKTLFTKSGGTGKIGPGRRPIPGGGSGPPGGGSGPGGSGFSFPIGPPGRGGPPGGGGNPAQGSGGGKLGSNPPTEFDGD